MPKVAQKLSHKPCMISTRSTQRFGGYLKKRLMGVYHPSPLLHRCGLNSKQNDMLLQLLGRIFAMHRILQGSYVAIRVKVTLRQIGPMVLVNIGNGRGLINQCEQ